MRLTGPQIAAAMALAGLTQEGLANEAGIGRNTLNKIINGTATYRDDTMSKIRGILEIRGIEFLPGEGVRKRDQIVQTYEGEGAVKRLIEDLFIELRDTGGEVLIAHLDEGNALKNLGEDFLMEQIRLRKEAGITHRLLVRAGDPNLIPPFDTYRSIPDEYFSPYPLYIYGSKLALMSWEPAPKGIIIDDKRFSESARKLFDFIWGMAKPVVEKGK